MGVAAEGAAAFGEAVAAAIPVIGWIVAIAAVLYMAFGSKGGAPKGGGSFNGSFDPRPAPSRAPAARASSRRARATRRWHRGPRHRQQLLRTAAQLGGTARGNVGFGIGFDTDPGGSAPNRISSSVTWAAATSSPARTATSGATRANIAPEMQLEASRMVLAALQSEPPAQGLGAMLNTVTASTATQDQINNVMQGAAALKSIYDIVGRDPLKDLATSAS
jgi:hypothetical protein